MSPFDQPSPRAPLNKVLPFPSEIRNIIYQYALSDPEQFPLKRRRARGRKYWTRTNTRTKKNWTEAGGGPNPASLQLLLVSRQSYIEAYHIYYRENTLRFPSFTRFSLFLRNTGTVRLQHIQNLFIEYNMDDELPFYRFPIWRLPSLRSLEVPCKHYTVHLDSGLATFLGDVRGLEIAKINRNLTALWLFRIPEGVAPWEELEQKLTRPRLEESSSGPSQTVDLFKPDNQVSKRDEQNTRQNPTRLEMHQFPGGREGGRQFYEALLDGKYVGKTWEIDSGPCNLAPLKVLIKNY